MCVNTHHGTAMTEESGQRVESRGGKRDERSRPRQDREGGRIKLKRLSHPRFGRSSKPTFGESLASIRAGSTRRMKTALP